MIHFSAAFGADHFGFFHDATDLDFAQKLRKLDLQIETIANGHAGSAQWRNAAMPLEPTVSFGPS